MQAVQRFYARTRTLTVCSRTPFTRNGNLSPSLASSGISMSTDPRHDIKRRIRTVATWDGSVYASCAPSARTCEQLDRRGQPLRPKLYSLRFVVDLLYSMLQNKQYTVQQQIERLQQIHILTCRDVVQLVVRLVVQQIHSESKQWSLSLYRLAGQWRQPCRQ